MKEGIKQPCCLQIFEGASGVLRREGNTLKGYKKMIHKDVTSDAIFLVGYSRYM